MYPYELSEQNISESLKSADYGSRAPTALGIRGGGLQVRAINFSRSPYLIRDRRSASCYDFRISFFVKCPV
jgi:hypothetical protein